MRYFPTLALKNLLPLSLCQKSQGFFVVADSFSLILSLSFFSSFFSSRAKVFERSNSNNQIPHCFSASSRDKTLPFFRSSKLFSICFISPSSKGGSSLAIVSSLSITSAKGSLSKFLKALSSFFVEVSSLKVVEAKKYHLIYLCIQLYINVCFALLVEDYCSTAVGN